MKHYRATDLYSKAQRIDLWRHYVQHVITVLGKWSV